jgi:phosphoglycerate dehydrogenase-like enzyme
MKVRVGVDESIDEALLKDFTSEVELVRIPAEPHTEVEVEFWIPFLSPRVVQNQWSHLNGVRAVQAPWAGVDSLRNIFPPGVTLCDARGVHDIPTAELAVTLILAMQKNFPFYIGLQTKGEWAGGQQKNQIDTPSKPKIKSPPVPMNEVADATVLIVGYGSIGKAIEARLAPFGAKFLRVARTRREGVEPVSKLDDLLGIADIVVLMTPLTSETRHLMDAKRLDLMKPGALLVNVARGPIVDTEALVKALNQAKIRAALDVTDPEPLPDGHPLWSAPNLLITPHVAGDSAKFMKRLFTFASQQTERYARGEPLQNVVAGEY